MSKEQRVRVDAVLRQPRPAGTQSVEAFRNRFKATMAQHVRPSDTKGCA
jgi:hypothetical protein